MKAGSHESSLIVETMLTIMEADIGSSSSKSFFSSEPTESVHTVVEVYVDDWFSELDRTLDESAPVEGRSVTNGKSPTIEPLQETS